MLGRLPLHMAALPTLNHLGRLHAASALFDRFDVAVPHSTEQRTTGVGALERPTPHQLFMTG